MNSVTLVGRLTRDPEVRKTQSGISVMSITIAANRKTTKDTADFIPVVAWRQNADFLGRYAHKGDLVGVEGMVTSREAVRGGIKAQVIEVTAERVELLSSKRSALNEAEQAEEEFEQAYRDADPKKEDLPF